MIRLILIVSTLLIVLSSVWLATANNNYQSGIIEPLGYETFAEATENCSSRNIVPLYRQYEIVGYGCNE